MGASILRDGFEVFIEKTFLFVLTFPLSGIRIRGTGHTSLCCSVIGRNVRQTASKDSGKPGLFETFCL